uniref:FAD/NAD(P)-binding domain-containing protein n=1 Tax=Cannabis sativa TaxID=3483 RepID=A0A803P9G2_CANSA
MTSIALKSFVGLRQSSLEKHHFTVQAKPLINVQTPRRFRVVAGKFSPKVTGRNLRVAIIGGGPAGGAAAETLAKGGIETFLIERKLDNCKPCGGAIPLCMVGEFDLPLDIIDRKVTKMKMISPSNVAVDIGQTLKPHEYIGMVRREVLDAYMRNRATENGAKVINGLFLKMDMPTEDNAPYVLHFTEYDGRAGGTGDKKTLEVDAVIGADGANSRVAKSIGAGDYEYAIAFQVLQPKILLSCWCWVFCFHYRDEVRT